MEASTSEHGNWECLCGHSNPAEQASCAKCNSSKSAILGSVHKLHLFPFSNSLFRTIRDIPWIRWLAWISLFPLLLSALLGDAYGLNALLITVVIAAYVGSIWLFLYTAILKPQLNNSKIAVMLAQLIVVMNFVLVPIIVFSEYFHMLFMTIGAGLIEAMGGNSDSFAFGFAYFTIGVGLPEEIGKAVPVYWLVFIKGIPLNTRTCVYAGTVSGLVFGVSEAVVYILNGAWLSSSEFAILLVVRLITLLFVHSMWSGIVAYFIAAGSRAGKQSYLTVVIGIVFVALVHGLYDTLATYEHPYLAFGVVAVSFLFYISYIQNAFAASQYQQDTNQATPANV